MAKQKKGASANNHLRARLEYLHRAATHLQSANQPTGTPPNQSANNPDAAQKPAAPFKTNPLSRAYISQLRGVSLKTQLRLPQDVKRSFCKRCDTLLVPDVNCAQEMHNGSRGGMKPWADVWIVRCGVCGTEKRFPRGQKRGVKLAKRKKRGEEKRQNEGKEETEERPSEAGVSW